MIEVELTCPLTDEGRSKLQEQIQEMTPEGVTRQRDTYYDTSTWELLRQAVFVRVRNGETLQFKFDEEGSEKQHAACVERAFSLAQPLPPEVHHLLRGFLPEWHAAATFSEAVTINGLVELAHLHKTRSTYRDGTMLVALDHVEGLGDFVEVELLCQEGEDTRQARAQVEAFVSRLGAEPLKAGYTELWLRQHNPEAYQCGQYHL